MMTQSGSEVVFLLAEDNDRYADLAQAHLRHAGVQNPLMRFRTGQEVLNFLFPADEQRRMPESHPDYVLLLDVRSPEVDGVEVWQRVRSEPEYEDLPLVLLTSGDDPREVALGCRLGLQAR